MLCEKNTVKNMVVTKNKSDEKMQKNKYFF